MGGTAPPVPSAYDGLGRQALASEATGTLVQKFATYPDNDNPGVTMQASIKPSWGHSIHLRAGTTAFALALSVACAGGHRSGESAPPAPSITTFKAYSAPISAGGSANLKAVFNHGTGVINPGHLAVSSGVPVAVHPPIDTIYTLTVTDPRGNAVTESANVAVLPKGLPLISLVTDIKYDSQADDGIAVDGSGNLYMVHPHTNAIRKLTPAGEETVLAGVDVEPGHVDGPGAVARFSDPHGLAVDGAGNVYVADTGNESIRKITQEGIVSTLVGRPGLELAAVPGQAVKFPRPWALALDGPGNLYVADIGTDTVQKITPNGSVSRLAGSGEIGGADGPGATASFRNPMGIAADTLGTLFVADSTNCTIRKITPDGNVSTFAELCPDLSVSPLQ